MKLLPTDRAASLLLAIHLDIGFYPCAFYPAATIRNGLAKLVKIGYIDDNTNKVTKIGKEWLSLNHIAIQMMP